MPDVIRVDGSGIVTKPASATTSALTLYVRSTGGDSNDGLTSGTALLTIQAAIDKVPKFLEHDAVIDIGSGTFSYFKMSGVTISADKSLSIRGVLLTPTLAGGTTSGTSTSGDAYSLTDSGQHWTVNDLRGRLLVVSGINYRIASNTATAITLASRAFESLGSKAYAIKDQDTTISTPAYDGVRFSAIDGGTFNLENLKIAAATDGDGFSFNESSSMIIVSQSSVEGASTGFVAQTCQDIQFYNPYVKNYAAYGMKFYLCSRVFTKNVLIYTAGSTYSSAIDSYVTRHFQELGATITSNTYDGVVLSGGLTCLDRLTVSNATLSGLKLTNGARVELLDFATVGDGYLAGTGNGRFGVNIGKGCSLTVGGVPMVTGTLGNYSFNDSFARTWATDFASNGDVMINDDTMSRVERVD